MPHQFTFYGRLTCLEIARGHDGFLRGKPEPVVIVAAYLVDGTTTYVVGRMLHRFKVTQPFPSEARSEATALPMSTVTVPDETTPRWVVLAIALEEDGGKDVQRLYGAVERYRALTVWTPDTRDVDPLPLHALPETEDWNVPREVELSVEGATESALCQSDKWIGAVCWRIRARGGSKKSRFRLPFLAADGRNDWTAIVDITR
jgi:hypothetical protein